MTDDFGQRMKLFRAEIEAAENLAIQVRRIRMTPPVDDDFPEVLHDYEGAIQTLLKACKDNGRTLS